MTYQRRLLSANVAALALLLIVLAVGWWEAAAFGLAVLALLDLSVLLRERARRIRQKGEG